MKVIVIGLGVQGQKRRQVAAQDYAGSVDPIQIAADYRCLTEVPLANYDAALVCTPDAEKIPLLMELIKNNKHVLVEKPLCGTRAELLELECLAKARGVVCYTAYNHRFEPHLLRVRDIVNSKELGTCYHARFFYGNGTARLVRDSAWRDQGSGVLHDLGSHLLDLIDFIFADRQYHFQCLAAHCFENKAPDYVSFMSQQSSPQILCEMSLLSWRNTFSCDIFAERGSVHVSSLCKWGPSQFTVRKRILPSGRPDEEVITLVQNDPTWVAEYQQFKRMIADHVTTDLSKDIWINDHLSQLNQNRKRMSALCQIN